jgi:hypothetical protein
LIRWEGVDLRRGRLVKIVDGSAQWPVFPQNAPSLFEDVDIVLKTVPLFTITRASLRSSAGRKVNVLPPPLVRFLKMYEMAYSLEDASEVGHIPILLQHVCSSP